MFQRLTAPYVYQEQRESGLGNSYIVIAAALITFVALPALIMYISRLIAPSFLSDAKQAPFEDGSLDVQPVNRYTFRFYLGTFIFLLLSVGTAFIIPCVVAFRHLDLKGIIVISVFLVVLLLGFAYAWRKRGLEWE